MKKFALIALCLLLAGPAFADNYRSGGYRLAGTQAKDVDTTTTNFNGSLSSADNTVQKALDTLDDASGGAAASITSGTAPTVDAAGEIAIDTTDDQLVYYGGAKRVLTYKRPAGFTLESPTTADDGVPIFSHGDSITVTNMRCYAVGGTSAEITLTDGTNALDTMTCDTDGAVDDGTIANSTLSAGEQVFYNTGTVTGSVTWVNFMYDYIVVAE